MKISKIKRVISGTVSAMMIASAVPFSASAAVGEIDLGSVTDSRVEGGFGGGGMDFGNMGGFGGGMDFGNMGGGGMDFGGMGGNGGGMDWSGFAGGFNGGGANIGSDAGSGGNATSPATGEISPVGSWLLKGV